MDGSNSAFGQMPQSVEQLKPPTELIFGGQTWQIEAVLGQGTYGMVVRARDPQAPHEIYAFKIVDLRLVEPDERLDQHEAVKVEGAILGALQAERHRALPAFYGMDDSNPDQIILKMEEVRGKSLRERVSRGEAMNETELLRVVHDIGGAVAVLHRLPRAVRQLLPVGDTGIVHLDLNPNNFLLADDGTYKLIDYGTSKTLRYFRHLDNELPAPIGSVLVHPSWNIPTQRQGLTTRLIEERYGTQPYADPVYVRDGKLLPRNDVYSFAVTLLTLALPKRMNLIKEEPYQPGNEEMLVALVDETTLSERFKAVLRRSLSSDLSKRPVDMHEFVSELTAFESKEYKVLGDGTVEMDMDWLKLFPPNAQKTLEDLAKLGEAPMAFQKRSIVKQDMYTKVKSTELILDQTVAEEIPVLKKNCHSLLQKMDLYLDQASPIQRTAYHAFLVSVVNRVDTSDEQFWEPEHREFAKPTIHQDGTWTPRGRGDFYGLKGNPFHELTQRLSLKNILTILVDHRPSSGLSRVLDAQVTGWLSFSKAQRQSKIGELIQASGQLLQDPRRPLQDKERLLSTILPQDSRLPYVNFYEDLHFNEHTLIVNQVGKAIAADARLALCSSLGAYLREMIGASLRGKRYDPEDKAYYMTEDCEKLLLTTARIVSLVTRQLQSLVDQSTGFDVKAGQLIRDHVYSLAVLHHAVVQLPITTRLSPFQRSIVVSAQIEQLESAVTATSPVRAQLYSALLGQPAMASEVPGFRRWASSQVRDWVKETQQQVSVGQFDGQRLLSGLQALSKINFSTSERRELLRYRPYFLDAIAELQDSDRVTELRAAVDILVPAPKTAKKSLFRWGGK